MADTAQQLLEKALRLSPADRSHLAAQLLASVEPADEGVEAAWAAEVERRFDSDRSRDVPWDDVRAGILAKYGYK